MSYQLNMAISDDMRDAIRAYAAECHISIAAAVRVLLQEALKAKQRDRAR